MLQFCSNRTSWPCLILVVLFVALPLQEAAGASSPPPSPLEEDLFTDSSLSRGFERDARGHLRPRKGHLNDFFSLRAAGDGLMRLKFESGAGLDLSLVFDAGTPAGDTLNLSMTSTSLRLLRTRGGKVQEWVVEPIRLSKRRRLEVVTLVQDGELLVEVFDAKKRVALRALQATIGFKPRRVGLVMRAGHDPALGIHSWAWRPPCLASWPPSKRGRARYLTVSSDVAAQAETLLSKKRWSRKERLASGEAVYRTDLEGVARLRCAGITAGPVNIETPWKYMDPSTLRHRHTPPKATRRGFRLDLGYKSPAKSEALLHAYAERYPRLARYVALGESHQGRPLGALVVGRQEPGDPPKPAILLNGAHHGNEPMSVEFVFDVIRRLLEDHNTPKVRRWLQAFEFWFVPVVNPDGLWAFLEESWRTGRKNGRDLNGDGRRGRLEGVDLNRNYPFRWGTLGERGSKSAPQSPWYRGESPASEPEVRAIMRLARSKRFAASLTYHTGTVKLLAPYTIEGVSNPSPNTPWRVAAGLIEGLEEHPQGKEWVLAKNLYPVDGTDQDWHRFENGTLALLVEGARRSPRGRKRRAAVLASVLPLATRLFDRLLRGPTLQGQVVDATGRPVEAEVRVKGVKLRAGEVWKSRCEDGHFTRVLAHAGRGSVSVHVPGHAPVERDFVMKRGMTRLVVQLDFPVEASSCGAGPSSDQKP